MKQFYKAVIQIRKEVLNRSHATKTTQWLVKASK